MSRGGGAFSGAVLAGGRSRRMGTDKAFIEIGGRLLVTIARDALLDAGAREVLAVGGDGGALGRLGMRAVRDRWPDEGPLGGVVTALGEAQHDPVVVLACDLPSVEAGAVTAVLSALDDADADAAVPFVDGMPQVLVAAYRRRCRDVLEAALRAGERRLRDAVGGLRVAPVTLAEPRWVSNVNQPADLKGLGRLERDGEVVDALQHPAHDRRNDERRAEPKSEHE